MKNLDLSPPSGTRDFFPETVKFRERVFAVIKSTFENFGFLPLETPAFERIETLMGKYGAEGEKLIYKILKRGEKAATGEVDLALRYDFTVPLARVVAQYPHKIGTVFKRYQIGPVWRADRPGKGRFREFYQCDVDIVGSSSRLADAEIILVVSEVLKALGLEKFVIQLNSRKVLEGLLESYDIPQASWTAVLTILDKLDKIGIEGVLTQLAERDIPAHIIEQLKEDLTGNTVEARLRTRLQLSDVGREGLSEVDGIIHLARSATDDARVVFNPSLARGLSYYTGPIFEVFTEELGLSIAGGGRYDELVGMFGKKPIPACGGSLGVERILSLLQEDEQQESASPQVLVTVWNEEFWTDAIKIAHKLRAGGISTEIFLGTGGIGKQIKYASDKGIQFCVLFGPDEKSRGEITVKNLRSGVQTVFKATRLEAEDLSSIFSNPAE